MSLTIERRLALVIALLGLLELWLTFQVPEPGAFLAVGPRVFPYILSGAMLLSALLLFILPPRAATKKAELDEAAEAAEHTDAAALAGASEQAHDESLEWQRVLLLGGLTLVYALLFQPLGFVLSTVPFIVGASRVLGSRNLVRDAIVAIVLAVAIYLLFSRILRVGLPTTPFGI